MSMIPWKKCIAYFLAAIQAPQTSLGQRVEDLMNEARADVAKNWRKVHERERWFKEIDKLVQGEYR